VDQAGATSKATLIFPPPPTGSAACGVQDGKMTSRPLNGGMRRTDHGGSPLLHLQLAETQRAVPG